MAYASASDVSNLAPHLTSSSGVFTTSSSPTLAAVNEWLSTGSAVIDTKLASKGYGAIGATSAAYGLAKQANAYFGAWQAETSLLSSRVSKMENSRADIFKKQFWEMLEMLCKMDLSMVGVTFNGYPENMAGGVSVSSKDENENDDDIVKPRFAKGQFRNPEVLDPTQLSNRRQVREDDGE